MGFGAVGECGSELVFRNGKIFDVQLMTGNAGREDRLERIRGIRIFLFKMSIKAVIIVVYRNLKKLLGLL